jgi:hypothetical protein
MLSQFDPNLAPTKQTYQAAAGRMTGRTFRFLNQILRRTSAEFLDPKPMQLQSAVLTVA